MKADSRLWSAVEAGKIERVRKAIAAGAEIDGEDEDGHTPLMSAAWGGHLDIVKLLIEKGADPNRWAQGDNPLSRAVAGGHREIYDYLRAIVSKDILESVTEEELVQSEKRRGREANSDVEEFISAAMMAKSDDAKAALDAGIDVNAIGSKGMTALHYASFYGHMRVINLLLEYGADVNAPNEEGIGTASEMTAIGLAASGICPKNRDEVVRLLAAAGADVDAQDSKGMTPLMHAVSDSMGFANSIRALIEVGANLDIRDHDGNTALMHAVCLRRTELQQILRDAGASETGVAEIELGHAAGKGNVAAVRELLSRGNVNVNHKTRMTPLTLASQYGHTEIARALIDAGADVNLRTRPGGFSPLLYAAYNGNFELTKLLIDAGADLAAEIWGIGTALDYARRGRDEHKDKQPWNKVIALLERAETPSTKGPNRK